MAERALESIKMHSANDRQFLSPCNLINMSAQMGRVDNKLRRNFTPMMFKKFITPDISPIQKCSPWLNRSSNSQLRSDKFRHRIVFSEENPNENPNLEKSLSVHTILVDLKLMKYEVIFNREEINLSAFFTLDKDDLKAIGIKKTSDINKILAFIDDVAAPKKTSKVLKPLKKLYR